MSSPGSDPELANLRRSSAAFPGRLGLLQRILPAYRADFFDLLAQTCAGGLSVFAGDPTSGEGIQPASPLAHAKLHKADNFHFLSPGHPLYFCWQGGLIRWVEGWDPDALILEANPRYLSSTRAVRWMRARKRPVLGWGLGAPSGKGPMEGIRRRRQSKFLSNFDALIAYSARGAEEYAETGYPSSRIFVAPNAASPRPVAQPVKAAPALEGPRTVLFIGRLAERKRVDNLIRACSSLPDPLKPRLLIVGDGPARTSLGILADELYPLAEFPGAVHGPDLEPYYSTADLFVLPGTGGLAVQEAMAHGLPVVVATGDGTQSDLVRPENGWNVADGDAAALAQVLEVALKDPARLRAMGNESFRIARDEINLEKMVEVFIEALNHALRSRADS